MQVLGRRKRDPYSTATLKQSKNAIKTRRSKWFDKKPHRQHIWTEVPVHYNESPIFAVEIAPSRGGDLDPICAYSSPKPKRHLDRFSRSCRAHDCDRPTDSYRQSVTAGRIAYSYLGLRCGLKNGPLLRKSWLKNNQTVKSVVNMLHQKKIGVLCSAT